MNRAIEWFARNHVAANLLAALLIVGGLITLPTIRQEMIPDVDLDVLTVTVPYPGASPAEVEEAICVRVEEALTGLPGIKRLRSRAVEGSGTVTVELMSGEDVARRLADVRARVDAIDTFPEHAEAPVVTQAEFGKQVLSIAISGPSDERTLKHLGERIRDDLAALPQITEVSLGAVRPYEVDIDVSEGALRQYGITFDQVVAAVRRSSLDLPGGTIRAHSGEILLRAKGQAYDGRAFSDIALLTRPDGTRLTVGDVAHVDDGFAETDQRASFDGKPAILLTVYQVGDQKTLEVADAAMAYVKRERSQLPPGVHLTIWQNSASYLGERIGSMLSNARSGFVLVALCLALFLRLRLALWVSMGIPTAFMGAVLVMPALGLSVNWITLLGFVVVLGIVVDDAIVVGENTYTEQQRTGEKLEGAIRGAQEIAVPVFFGVATTIAAFAPMLFLPGVMGRLTRSLPIIVIACLTFSVLEAMFVLPAHLGQGRSSLDAPPGNELSRRWRKVQDRVARGTDRVIEHRYRPSLDWALEWRYLTIAIGIAMLAITVALLAGGWLRFTFQEPVEGDVMIADLTMAPGTPAEVTGEAVRRLEAAARAVQAETDAQRDPKAKSIFQHILSTVGEQPWLEMQSKMPGGAGASAVGSSANLGEVQVEMIDPDHRDIGTNEMMRRWRQRVGPLAGVEKLEFMNGMINSGKPVEVQLRGDDLNELQAAAKRLKERLVGYTGVYDVSDSFRSGKQELRFQVLPAAESLGISMADVARQVRQAFWGEEAQRIQRGRDDVRVVVRYPPAQRRSLGEVEDMRIRTATGASVPFSMVAKAELGKGFSAIDRVDRERVVTVMADVDVSQANANEIVANLEAKAMPEIMASFPGVHWEYSGQQADQREFMGAMVRGQIWALMLIYVLLAIPLRSYLMPLVIMTAIPFGLVGAALGHLLLGYDFSMYSMIGLVALSGVVVNASLVMVDQVNKLRDAGERMTDAVRIAGRSRLRAIWLTSVTTFLGLTPMMFQHSLGARFMIPLAISLGFGVMFSSFITLYLVPCAYLVLEDFHLLMLRMPRRRAVERIRAAEREQERRAAEGEAGLEGNEVTPR